MASSIWSKLPPSTGPPVTASSKSKLWRSSVAKGSAPPSTVSAASARPVLLKPHPRRRLAHPQHARRHAGDDRVGGYVARDHRVRPDHRVVADGHAAEDAGAVADPDVVAHAHVALVDPLEPYRAIHLDHAVVEVDQHHAVGDHALAADRHVLVRRDRALLAEHGLGADRDRALVAADLAPVPHPRPAAKLECRALADLDAAPGADERESVELQLASEAQPPDPQSHDQAPVLEVEHPVAPHEAQQREGAPVPRRGRGAAIRIGGIHARVHNCTCNDQNGPHSGRSPELSGERAHAARVGGVRGDRRGRGRAIGAQRDRGAPAGRGAARRPAPRHRRNRGGGAPDGKRLEPSDRAHLEPGPCRPWPVARPLRRARLHSKGRALRRRAGGTPLRSLRRALWGLGLAGFIFGVVDAVLILTSDHANLRGAVVALGLIIGWVWVVTTMHTLLAAPHGRLSTGDQRIVTAAYLLVTVGILPLFFFFDPASECEECPENVFLVERNDTAVDIFGTAINLTGVVLVLLVLRSLVRRWRAATRAERRLYAPMYGAGVALMLALIGQLALQSAIGQSDALVAVSLLSMLPFALVPYLFLGALVRARLVQGGAVGALVARLAEAPAERNLRDALAEALDDPSLELHYWLPERQQFVDL